MNDNIVRERHAYTVDNLIHVQFVVKDYDGNAASATIYVNRGEMEMPYSIITHQRADTSLVPYNQVFEQCDVTDGMFCAHTKVEGGDEFYAAFLAGDDEKMFAILEALVPVFVEEEEGELQ